MGIGEYLIDKISATDSSKLAEILLTSDGQGKTVKSLALKELIHRAIDFPAQYDNRLYSEEKE